ncbi:MAG: hypothetical protein N3D11_15200 [Candidatus Sumerlaeia bacterium]|nr:hypothetical protein [Candidatus Sumerlaeia bacterium]
MTTKTSHARTAIAAAVCIWISAIANAGEPAPQSIDMNLARQILQKSRTQTLSTTESAYLEKAKAIRAHAAAQSERPAAAGRQRPTALTGQTSTSLVPLDEMSAQARYKNEDGGLYGGGKNEPPAAHLEAARKEAAQIIPRNADGQPAPDGKIVLLSIGMSNTTQEFSRFKQLADADPAKSPHVVIVDGARGGQDAARWSEKAGPQNWDLADAKIKDAGATPLQVQAVWLKQARIAPAQYGDFPAHAQELKDHLVSILHIAKKRYPNLRIAYLSSRTYAGFATTQLNPEPYAYESAFAVRWLVQDQINGDPKLNYNPARGPVMAPLLLWGPYLWANGVQPRKSDGFFYVREDFAADGTHPSPTSGRDKVAGLLLKFFKSDPTARPWFVGK